MSKLKKLNIWAVIYGILWIWTVALLWRYINIDGWILYPIAGTLVFLLLVTGFYLLWKYEQYKRCNRCGLFQHKEEMVEDNSKWELRWYCHPCWSKERGKKEEDEDD